jgi:hypothetical protein
MSKSLAGAPSRERSFWIVFREELREVAWLVSLVTGLSIVGVALAIALAAT